MYDPVIGRFTTVDPYGIGFSPYIGMDNNLINLVDPDGGCPTCPQGEEADAVYAVGALVENNRGSWQYLGEGEWKDLSNNPSVSSHNETGYFYNADDIVVRNALFSLGSDNIVTSSLLRMEQNGEFVPLTRQGFYDEYVDKWNTNAAFWHAIEGGYFDTPAPGSPGDMLSSSKNFRIRPIRGKAFEKGLGFGKMKPKLSGMLRSGSKNPWNAFLKANKGKYSGSNWIQKARQDYRVFKGLK